MFSVFITTSCWFKCVIEKWVLLLDFVHRRLDLFLWVFTSELGGGGACRTAGSVMTKLRIHSFWKRWDLLEEDSRKWNNSTIKQLPAAACISRCISFLFWLVNELQRMIENILSLQVFSLNVLKFHLYLLKQSIFRALKRDLEWVYLIIVSQICILLPVIGVLIYAHPSFTSVCEACLQVMYS